MKKDNKNFIYMLKFFGWSYLICWIVGGFILILNFKEEISIPILYTALVITRTNYIYLIISIGGVLQAIMILMIMLGIARILENNNENIEQT